MFLHVVHVTGYQWLRLDRVDSGGGWNAAFLVGQDMGELQAGLLRQGVVVRDQCVLGDLGVSLSGLGVRSLRAHHLHLTVIFELQV